jgi:hypothetical protein
VLGENGEGLEKRASKRQKIAPLEFVKGSVNSGSGGGNRSWESSEPKCEFCHGTHDGSYGTGRFCSQNCQYGFIASSRATRKNAKREFKLSLEPTKPSNSSSGGGGGNAERDGGEPWCEHCHGVTHDTQDGSYGTGRFCTQQCRHEEEDEEVEAEGVDEIDFIASILVEDEEAGAEAAHEKHEEEDGDEAEKVDEQEFGATTQTANAKVTEEEIHEKKRDENMDEAEVQAEEEDEDNQVHVAENNQTVAQIAALRGLEVSDLLKINLPSLPGLTKSAKLYPGTHIWLRGPPQLSVEAKKVKESEEEPVRTAQEEDELDNDEVHVAENNETVTQIAAMRRLEVFDLLRFNLPSLPGLTKSAKLYPGTHIWLRGPP